MIVQKPRHSSLFVLGNILRARSQIHVIRKIKERRNQYQHFNNEGVYVLHLPGDKYYIGKSKNIKQRLEEHAAVTKIVQRLPPCTPYLHDWESWERAETLHWMKEKGVEKVRGWMYVRKWLTSEEKEHAKAQIFEKYDLCRLCGSDRHFAKHCSTLTSTMAMSSS